VSLAEDDRSGGGTLRSLPKGTPYRKCCYAHTCAAVNVNDGRRDPVRAAACNGRMGRGMSACRVRCQHEHVFQHVFFLRRVVEYNAALLEHAPGTDVVVGHVGVQRPVEVDVEERAQGRGRVAVPPRSARSSSSMGAASFLIVLRHIPLHRINDAQERQPHRPEKVLPVHELPKRRAPVHNSIVIAAKRMLVRREALSRRTSWLLITSRSHGSKRALRESARRNRDRPPL
jgi:hypothetical protein